MQNNICPDCNTVNEPEYRFCKNCGKPLYSAGVKETSNVPVGQSGGAEQNEDTQGFIDGNTVEEVVTFVGKNAHKIVPQFLKIQNTNSKVCWSWPPFILGFFFGPIGVAIWFLYRKMYSVASAFAGVGILVNFVMFALDRVFGIGVSSTGQALENYLENFLEGRIDFREFIMSAANKQSVLSYVANSLNSTISIAAAVLGGIFGIYLYKRHAAKKISQMKATVYDGNFVKFGIAAKGGTSVGAVIVGLLIITVVINLPDMVLGALSFVKGGLRL